MQENLSKQSLVMDDKTIHRVYASLNLYHFANDAISLLIPSVLGRLYEIFKLNYLQSSFVLAFNLGFTVIFQMICGVTNG